ALGRVPGEHGLELHQARADLGMCGLGVVAAYQLAQRLLHPSEAGRQRPRVLAPPEPAPIQLAEEPVQLEGEIATLLRERGHHADFVPHPWLRGSYDDREHHATAGAAAIIGGG